MDACPYFNSCIGNNNRSTRDREKLKTQRDGKKKLVDFNLNFVKKGEVDIGTYYVCLFYSLRLTIFCIN